ncbi:MAG: LysR family transcriptional regulator [Bacilli bacterium]|nr:LysR family transcriptional regulator [Bacilli bacterium]
MPKLLMPLKYFIAVAETESFTLAASRFGVSQSAISQQVKSLEEEVGVTLFARVNRVVKLTGAGTILLPKAKAVVAKLDQAFDEVRSISGIKRDLLEICVGVDDKNEAAIFDALVDEFQANHPSMMVKFKEKKPQSLPIYLSKDLYERNGYERLIIREEPLLLVINRNNAMASLDSVSLTSLRGLPLIMPKGAAEWFMASGEAKPSCIEEDISISWAKVKAHRGLLVIGADEEKEISDSHVAIPIVKEGAPAKLRLSLFYSRSLDEADSCFVSFVKEKLEA